MKDKDRLSLYNKTLNTTFFVDFGEGTTHGKRASVVEINLAV
ncbi:hypothetical protein ACQKOF_05430 [Lysinibacillus sp. NPDC093190]